MVEHFISAPFEYSTEYKFWAVHREFEAGFHEVFFPDVDDAMGAGDTLYDASVNALNKLHSELERIISTGSRQIPTASTKDQVSIIGNATVDEQKADFPTKYWNVLQLTVNLSSATIKLSTAEWNVRDKLIRDIFEECRRNTSGLS